MRIRSGPMGICLGVILLLTFVLTGTQTSGRKFVVGVLQEHGNIIPFARYDGARWANTWPGPIEPVESKPAPLQQIPPEWLGGESVPANWRLWLPGGTSRAVHILGPEYIKSDCGDNWGLRTDFPKPQKATEFRCPVPEIGIALSTDQKLLPMKSIEPGQLSIATLEAAFSSAEEQQIAEQNAAAALTCSLGFPNFTGLDAATRLAFPIKIEHAWRQVLNSGDALTYLEASRKYAGSISSQSDCPANAAFQGWIVKASGKSEKFIGKSVRITDCDFKGVDFVTPMGLLELPGGIFAIVQINGWESQSYAVLKLDSDGTQTLVDSPVR